MDLKISNSGSYIGSGFLATVTGVSQPIKTSDLKIVTSWTNSTGGSGGNTSVGKTTNVQINPDGTTPAGTIAAAPFGFGLNSTSTMSRTAPKDIQQFGNYTLQPGVSLVASPYGTSGNGYGVTTKYVYSNDVPTDAAKAILGKYWSSLRTGDKVSVSVVHIPTGKTIFQKTVTVTEG